MGSNLGDIANPVFGSVANKDVTLLAIGLIVTPRLRRW
jgi:hypothetical protein